MTFATTTNGTTARTERLRIDNTGNVGIGTTTPAYTLDVNGTARFTGAVNFAAGQSFPGTGTLTSVAAGTGLSGGGTSGAVTLTNTGLLGATAGTGILVGSGQVPSIAIDSTTVPRLSATNAFTASQQITSTDAYALRVSDDATGNSPNALYVTTGSGDNAANAIYAEVTNPSSYASAMGAVSQGGGAVIYAQSNSTSSTYAAGVNGIINTTGTGSAALAGDSMGTTGATYGVYGSNKSSSGYGVAGVTSSQSGVTYGVYGSTYSPDGAALYGYGIGRSCTTTNGVQTCVPTSGGTAAKLTTNINTGTLIAGWGVDSNYSGTKIFSVDGTGKGFFKGGISFADGTTQTTAGIAASTGITSVSTGTGLTISGPTTTPTLAVDTAIIQSRVTGTCTTGQTITAIAADGSVTCQSIAASVNSTNRIATLQWWSSQSIAVGGSPWAIGFDGTYVWTAVNSAVVVKTLGTTVVGSYTLSNCTSMSGGAAIAFDGANLWIACSGGNTVVKMLAADGSTVGTYTVGNNPYAAAFDGTYIWIANWTDATVSKLKASDGSLIGTYTVGTHPRGIAFDGTYIWVTNYEAATVTKLLSSDGSTVGTYSTNGTRAWGIVFDGTYLWVTCPGLGNKLVKMLPSDGSIVASYTTGNTPGSIVFDGTNIWVAHGNLSKIQAATGTILTTYTLNIGIPRTMVFDGSGVVVGGDRSNNLTRFPAP
jgi:hypothetical protein